MWLLESHQDANKKLHDHGQEYTTLSTKVVPLRVEIADLKDALKEKDDKMGNLEERVVTREVHLGKVEGELAERPRPWMRANKSWQRKLRPSSEPNRRKPPKLRRPRRSRQSSLLTPRRPMVRDSKMLWLRWLASILRWTLRFSSQPTMWLMAISCLVPLNELLAFPSYAITLYDILTL